jgi:thioester reductase-like protein
MTIERLLLTGAAGFLGQAILRELESPLRSPDDPLCEIRLLDLDESRL